MKENNKRIRRQEITGSGRKGNEDREKNGKKIVS
jgi:hypothetical protein